MDSDSDVDRTMSRQWREVEFPLEVQWFDVSVRRPNNNIAQSTAKLPKPTERYISTYSRGGNAEDIKLVLEGFKVDSEQTMISSGLATWEASEHLCKYLLTDNELKERSYSRLLELGSGLGKCGLLAHLLAHPARIQGRSIAETVLTDGDTSALKLLRMNVFRNTGQNDDVIRCTQLIWGRDAAKQFLSEQRYNREFDIIIGSDLLYTNGSNIDPLFETVQELLDGHGKFILAHNEMHEVRVDDIVNSAAKMHLFHEILKQDGQISILCFKQATAWNMNEVMRRLQKRNTVLKNQVHELKTSKRFLEDKCKGLDERCTFLRGDGDVLTGKSILISLDEDMFAGIASFLKSEDFAYLASTCKFFGLNNNTHKIGTEQVSLMKKIAYNLFESASGGEKKALPVYTTGKSPFFFYNELLGIREPLKFDLLIGRGIENAIGDQSKVVKSNREYYPLKMAPGSRRMQAYTAVSNHVMKAGRHFVTFMSQESETPLWFGVVRPLQKLKSKLQPAFTPTCSYYFDQLRNLVQTPGCGDSNIQCCLYMAESGECQWTDWNTNNVDELSSDDSDNEDNTNDGVHIENWEGMQTFHGGTIGMLLDYEAGSLTVFKNGSKLGVIKEGLSGDYCWMVTVGTWFSSSSDGIKIERSRLPEDVSEVEQDLANSLKRKRR